MSPQRTATGGHVLSRPTVAQKERCLLPSVCLPTQSFLRSGSVDRSTAGVSRRASVSIGRLLFHSVNCMPCRSPVRPGRLATHRSAASPRPAAPGHESSRGSPTTEPAVACLVVIGNLDEIDRIVTEPSRERTPEDLAHRPGAGVESKLSAPARARRMKFRLVVKIP